MIKQYRKRNKLTLADMEKLTRVDSSYISKMERNESAYKGTKSYEKIAAFIRMDNRLNRVKTAKAYDQKEVKRGVLVNFIYKLLNK